MQIDLAIYIRKNILLVRCCRYLKCTVCEAHCVPEVQRSGIHIQADVLLSWRVPTTLVR